MTAADGERIALKEILPARLRAWRKHNGLTLNRVAMLVKSTPQTIQRLETGNMTLSVDWLDRLIDGLGISHEALFAGLGSTQKPQLSMPPDVPLATRARGSRA